MSSTYCSISLAAGVAMDAAEAGLEFENSDK